MSDKQPNNGLKSKFIQASNSKVLLYSLTLLGVVLTILFVIAFVTGRNLIDFAAAVLLLLLTASYVREIVQRRRRS